MFLPQTNCFFHQPRSYPPIASKITAGRPPWHLRPSSLSSNPVSTRPPQCPRPLPRPHSCSPVHRAARPQLPTPPLATRPGTHHQDACVATGMPLRRVHTRLILPGRPLPRHDDGWSYRARQILPSRPLHYQRSDYSSASVRQPVLMKRPQDA
jgi:hypothetical protein